MHCLDTAQQFGGDLAVAQARCDEAGDFQFLRCEFVDVEVAASGWCQSASDEVPFATFEIGPGAQQTEAVLCGVQAGRGSLVLALPSQSLAVGEFGQRAFERQGDVRMQLEAVLECRGCTGAPSPRAAAMRPRTRACRAIAERSPTRCGKRLVGARKSSASSTSPRLTSASP